MDDYGTYSYEKIPRFLCIITAWAWSSAGCSIWDWTTSVCLFSKIISFMKYFSLKIELVAYDEVVLFSEISSEVLNLKLFSRTTETISARFPRSTLITLRNKRVVFLTDLFIIASLSFPKVMKALSYPRDPVWADEFSKIDL